MQWNLGDASSENRVSLTFPLAETSLNFINTCKHFCLKTPFVSLDFPPMVIAVVLIPVPTSEEYRKAV